MAKKKEKPVEPTTQPTPQEENTITSEKPTTPETTTTTPATPEAPVTETTVEPAKPVTEETTTPAAETATPEATDTTPTAAETTPQPTTEATTPTEAEPTTPQPTDDETTPPDKSGHSILIALGIVLILVIIAGAVIVYFVFSKAGKDNNEKNDDEQSQDKDNGDTEECTYDAEFIRDVTIPANTEIEAGKSISKTWQVRNTGSCDWTDNVHLEYVSGDKFSEDFEVTTSEANANETSNVNLSIKAPTTIGTYQSVWKLFTDDGKEFGDPLSLEIKVKAAANTPDPADLIITEVRTEPTEVRKGVQFTIFVKIKNVGGSNAVGFKWGWRACDHDTCPYQVAPNTVTLTAGEETTVQMNYTYNSWSTYTTVAKVDTASIITESNEDNNTKTLSLAVKPGLPDLVVNSISFSPNPPVSGAPVTVTIVIENEGAESTGEDFRLHWWSSIAADDPACNLNVPALAAGQTRTLTCTHTYPSWYANITTRAIVDPVENITELHEDNNRLDKVTSVAQP